MTGRAATTAALYAGFLAAWALGDAVLRRRPSPYLLLGAGLLEAVLVLGAVIGAAGIGEAGEGAAVHGGYLAASVALLPLGLLIAREIDPDGAARLAPAPLAVALVALAVVILRVSATA